ncbi:DUF3783 domain-containing protein [Desulfosarcina sp. OttesenSCG-928-A07]|nr:DUF3783 domain-containing protein [Desulfosarcina sp. OttesenSCG-928-G17]MDL2329482.1 DUF3783 domain-containing protein [Desulfosarcina sp. OttesenSCG-928-A07]
MQDASFEKVHYSDTPLYGPKKLILCGFPQGVSGNMEKVLKMAGISDVPVVWADSSHLDQLLSELLQLAHGSEGGKKDSALPRAIIVSGITENQLHALMAICRQTGMQKALWATLTPTSENWTLGKLLGELEAERKALSQYEKNADTP